MAWYYEKLSQNSNSVIYAYGRETKEVTGQLKYDMTTGEYSVLKVADNDTKSGAEWALSHLSSVIEKGFPEKDIVMIG